MKINHFICPTCGHDFYASDAYATCDSCQTFFYAAASRTNEQNRAAPLNIVKWFAKAAGEG